MGLDRALGDEQACADLLVTQAFGDEPGDFGLARSEDSGASWW
jgi:hypothetical protein